MQIITKEAVFNNYSDLDALCLSDAVIGADFNSLATSGDVINFIFNDIPQGSENKFSDTLDTLIASYIDLPEVKIKVGTTSERPSNSKVPVSFHYHDTTLGFPVWNDGTNWIDATGATK